MKPMRDLLLGLAAVAGLSACGSAPPGPPATPIEPGLAVATFDSAWAIIERNHFDPEFEGVDWQAVREELRPEAAAAETNEELRHVLHEMIGRMPLSHFAIYPADAVDALSEEGDGADDGHTHGHAGVGIEIRLVDRDVVVWKVRPDSPADSVGIGTGWVLEAIDGHRLDDRLERAGEDIGASDLEILAMRYSTALLTGAEGSTVELVLRDGADTEHTFELERETAPGRITRFGNLPPMRVSLRDQERTLDGTRVGVIDFNIWLVPIAADFDRAIDRHRGADGLILDLRGNPGGVAGMAMGFAGHVLDERASLGVMSTRTTRLEIRANPRRVNPAGERVEPFDGPLAILVDGLSMSTSEIFAQGLQTIGRARVFGQRTPGAALPSQITRLPNGDALQFAFADFVDPEGVRLEARGVIPDEVVSLERDDLLAGRDAPMQAALEWIAAESRP